MTCGPLSGYWLLVVEDQYLIADDLARELGGAGASVLGPVANCARALQIIQDAPHLDGAILDINLAGEMVYPVADRLVDLCTPFVPSTGYDRMVIPDRFAKIVRCEKPATAGAIGRALGMLIAA